MRWDWRFFQTFLGILVVDAFSVFKRFRPEKRGVTHTEFLLALTAYLLDKNVGAGHGARLTAALCACKPW